MSRRSTCPTAADAASTPAARLASSRAHPRLAARGVAGLALTALLAACGTAPLSFLYDHKVYYQAVLHRYPVFITSVDRQSTDIFPWPVTPGAHVVALNALPVAGFNLPVQKTYTMTIAPCTRYFLAAQRDTPLLQDWNLVVEHTEAVAGCDPQKEIQKAQVAASKGEQPALSSVLMSDPAIAPGALPPPALQQFPSR